jgi:hypothetical protein
MMILTGFNNRISTSPNPISNVSPDTSTAKTNKGSSTRNGYIYFNNVCFQRSKLYKLSRIEVIKIQSSHDPIELKTGPKIYIKAIKRSGRNFIIES